MLLDITSAFYSWIRGGLLVLFIYHFIFYLQNKEKLHKYYSGYLFCLVVYLVRDAFVSENVQYYYQYISFSIQYVGYVFFIYFCRELTKSKIYFPVLDYRAKILSGVLFLLACFLLVIQYFYGYEVQKQIVAYSVPFATFCAFYVFYLLSKRKTRQVYFLLFGSVFFLISANISLLKMIKGNLYLIDWSVHRMFYYFVGAIVQSTIFAILIGNHFREIIIKKQEAEVNLLKQSNQISQLKMIALKSQMNPHFLFNSLNSINNFVIQNKIDEASNFITKFSSLVRKVLQVTNENSISLTEELHILSIYVKLEQMRLKNGFHFKTVIDHTIDADRLKVVPLFLQPFIENAIWHGLSLKQGEKTILLTITQINEMVNVFITDNGIGINNSKKNKINTTSSKKSYGIKIVKERMELMYEKEIVIQIKDVSEKNTTGTRVLLIFPVKTL